MVDEAKFRLYFIMGSNNTNKDPLRVLEQAIKGGITMFQFREKGVNAKTGAEKRELGWQLRQKCRNYNIPFIVNDDVELANDLDADGIHIGQNDESIQYVHKRVPSHYMIGVSVSNPDEAVQAEKQGADYIGVGPIYQTFTKENAMNPIGLTGLKDIRNRTDTIPIVAIGGITNDSAPHVMQSGATGIAVISAISQAEDSYASACRLFRVVK
ncbi:MAG TPA: thiamine phosphate synthase [Bacillota bacterium]|nr:thiamine phosphate synthase [Bacillota bacterium]